MPVISLSPSLGKPLPSGAEHVVQRGGGVAAFGDESDRVLPVGVVDADVEQVRRVEGVALQVQAVAGVLDEGDVVAVDERDVVERCVCLVALVEHAQRAVVGAGLGWVSLNSVPQPPNPVLAVLVVLVSPVAPK